MFRTSESGVGPALPKLYLHDYFPEYCELGMGSAAGRSIESGGHMRV